MFQRTTSHMRCRARRGACWPARRSRSRRRIAIATGGTGGVYYPLGGGLANLISKNMPGYQATAEVTGGSVDNLKLIGSGQSELAFSMADAALDALQRRRTSSRATRSRCAP